MLKMKKLILLLAGSVCLGSTQPNVFGGTIPMASMSFSMPRAGAAFTERPWHNVDYPGIYRNILWLDSGFEAPAKRTKGKSKLDVRIEFVSSATGRWDELHYWVYSYSNPAGTQSQEFSHPIPTRIPNS